MCWEPRVSLSALALLRLQVDVAGPWNVVAMPLAAGAIWLSTIRVPWNARCTNPVLHGIIVLHETVHPRIGQCRIGEHPESSTLRSIDVSMHLNLVHMVPSLLSMSIVLVLILCACVNIAPALVVLWINSKMSDSKNNHDNNSSVWLSG